MARKYLSELNTDLFIYGMLDDDRQDKWRKEREECGFDSRETWSMPCSFLCWLYERLRMYSEVNIVDMTYHKFKIGDEELTQQECLDKMLEIIRGLLIEPKDGGYLSFEEEDRLWNALLPIFSESIRAFWW